MPIQDDLNGALLISVIDFILSFIIIGGIGAILSLFPLLNKLSKRDGKAPLTTPPERSALKESAPAAALSTASTLSQPAVTGGIHPGLSNQQLVVLLTAAASEMLGGAVRIDRLRPLTTKNGSWAAQGRHDLQSHRLK